jgi:hypothetical protein
MILFGNYNSGILFISGFKAPDFLEAFQFYATITRVWRIYQVAIPLSLLFGLI